MTITSLDALPASGPISFSEMRTFYDATGAVSLNATFNGETGPVPDTLPAAGVSTSMSAYLSASRILRKQGTTEIVTSTGQWTPRSNSAVEYHVWAIGGGGSGGCASTDSGRESVGSGGGAGGTAFRRYSASTHSVTSASVTIGAGAVGAYRSPSNGAARSGGNGGTTTFTPNGTGTAISATGGTRGFGSEQGNSTIIADYDPPTTPVGEYSSGSPTGTWGACSAGEGGSGSGGESNYTGGKGTFCSVGSNNSEASGGGSPDLGFGGHDGTYANSSSTAVTGAVTAAPTQPTEWGSDVTATFQGSAATASASSSSAPPATADAANYGAGSGGSAAESTAASSGNGAPGVVIINYYEVNT